MKKGGQVTGQVFVYLAGIIIIAMIILYGFNAIKGFLSKADTAALITFKTDLQKNIKEMSEEYEGMRRITLNMPSGFDEVCFTDTRKPDKGGIEATERAQKYICKKTNKDYRPLVCNFWKNNKVPDNVFLLSNDGKIEPMFIGIEGDEESALEYTAIISIASHTDDKKKGYLCIKQRNNAVKISLKGKGTSVEIQRKQTSPPIS